MKTRIASDDSRFEVVVPTSLWSTILKRAEELQDDNEEDAMVIACVETMSLVARLMTVLEQSFPIHCVSEVK